MTKVIHAEEVIELITGQPREDAEKVLAEMWPNFLVLGMDDMLAGQVVDGRMIVRIDDEGIVAEVHEG